MSQDALEKPFSQDQALSTKNLIDKESQSYDSPENNVTLSDVQKTSSENKVKFIYSEKATKILRNLPLTFDQ